MNILQANWLLAVVLPSQYTCESHLSLSMNACERVSKTVPLMFVQLLKNPGMSHSPNLSGVHYKHMCVALILKTIARIKRIIKMFYKHALQVRVCIHVIT